MNLKHCSKCDQDLPATNEFWATDRSREDGLCPDCKACQYKRRRELKAINIERKTLAAAGLKKCTGCEIAFPATEEYFYKAKKTPTGLTAKCKKCHAENVRATKDKERERYTAYKYFLAHKEEAYERRRHWRDRNLEAVREYERQQKRRDPKRIERNREWAKKNPDKLRNQRQAYRQKAADKLKAIVQRYLARKASLPNDFTEKDWQFALDYFGGRCAACGRPAGLFHTLAMDHWVALSDPDCPGTIPANIAPLCHGADGCNNSKHNKSPQQWLTDRFGEAQAKTILVRIHEFFSRVRQVDT